MATQFGVKANVNSVPDICVFAEKLGVDIIRTAITVKTYSGNGGSTDKVLNDGKKVALTLNWGDVKKDSQGNKVPVPFPTNLEDYKSKLRPIIKKYGAKENVIMIVCENEPTTNNFHSGPMSDYLKELEAFVQVCGEEGCIEKTCAGAVHVELVKSVMNNTMNDATSEGKAKDVKTLLDGYKNIDFKYLNFHTSGSGSSYPKQNIIDTAKWALDHTNKQLCTCDEWHIENYDTVENGKKMTSQISDGMKEAGYSHSIYITGSGGDSDEALLNDYGTYDLTPIGDTYKEEAVKPPPEDPDLTRLKEIWDITEEGILLVKKLKPDEGVPKACTKVIDAGNILVSGTSTYNFNHALLDLDGSPVKDDEGNVITLGHALANALVLTEQTHGNADKIYHWAITLHNGKPLLLTEKDRHLLIHLIRHHTPVTILLRKRVLETLNGKHPWWPEELVEDTEFMNA
jgi:hypothetical protein